MNSKNNKKGYSFLLVDDDPTLIELVSSLLDLSGHSVAALESSEGALDVVKETQPDCVLVDLMMPGVNGMHLLKSIRDDEELEKVRVIVISAKSFEFDQRQAMKLGADMFIAKPIDPDTFAATIEEIMEDLIQLTFWGVRGTLPVSGERSLRYGGNTSCVTMEFPRGQYFIFDAGSGIKELSNALLAEQRQKMEAKIFVSHPHWDHINALPFFVPLYIPGNEFEILGASHAHISMREMISAQMDDIYFPITIKEFGSRVYFRDLQEGEYEVEGIKVKTLGLSHPGNCLGYRLEYRGRSICYVTDNELFLPDTPNYDAHYMGKLTKFVQDADVLITDCTYTDEEYTSKIGWGHSSIGQVVDLAHNSQVKTLYLFHHDPDQDDDAIDAKFETAKQLLADMKSATVCVAPAETDSIKI